MPEYVKQSQNWKSWIWKSSNFPLEALEDKKQSWHYAEVLHLETGLQDTSLQSQQGARNLALPASASAGGWGCRTGQTGDQSVPPTTSHCCPALLPRLSWSFWALTFLSHGHHSLDLTGGFAQRTPHQGPRTRNLHLLTVFKFYGGFKKSWES